MGQYVHPGDILPHGDVFLLVDEILSFEESSITTCRRIPFDEPWTNAHFPGNQIVPGVLILEGMVQTCGILVRLLEAQSKGAAASVSRHGSLASVRLARFRQSAHPGEVLQYCATLIAKVESFYSFKTTATVDGVDIADAEVCLSIMAT